MKILLLALTPTVIFNLEENVRFGGGVTLIVSVLGVKTTLLFKNPGSYAILFMFQRHGTEGTLIVNYSVPEHSIKNRFNKKLDVVFCCLFMLFPSL